MSWVVNAQPDAEPVALGAVAAFRVAFDVSTHCVLFREDGTDHVVAPVFGYTVTLVGDRLVEANTVEIRDGDLVRVEGGYDEAVAPSQAGCGVQSSWLVSSISRCGDADPRRCING